MRKLSFLFLSLLVAGCLPGVFAQKKSNYHFFHLNNKTGVTDSSAKELLPPLYRCHNSVYDLIWEMVENDTSSVIFNTATGAQSLYKHISPYAASLEDGHYSHVSQHHGPSLLFNSQTGKSFELGREYEEFQREDHYLFASYYLPGSTVRNHQSRRLDVLDMRAGLQPVVRGVYASVQCLYKAGTVQKSELSLVPFDAVVFSLYQQHQLYDKNMKLIKNFTSAKTGSQNLALASSRILQYSVLPSYKELPQEPVGLAQSVVDGSARRPPVAILMAKKTDDSTTLVYLDRMDKGTLPLFTTTAKAVYVNREGLNIMQFNDQNRKTAEVTFDVDLATGRCMLPQAYWKALGMKPAE